MKFLFFFVFHLFFDAFSSIYSYEKRLWSSVYVFIYCVGAGINILMSFSGGSDPYFFRRKIEKTRSMKEQKEWEVFISHQSRRFSFTDKSVKVFHTICTLIWRVNIYVSRQGKGSDRRNESIFVIIL